MLETCPETIWRSVYDPDILSPEATLTLRNGNVHEMLSDEFSTSENGFPISARPAPVSMKMVRFLFQTEFWAHLSFTLQGNEF